MSRFPHKFFGVFLWAVLVLPAPTFAQSGGSTVPWMMVPPAVQQTIRQNVGSGNRIQKVLMVRENGSTAYLAMIATNDGTFAMIKVAPNGSLLDHVSNADKQKEEEEKKKSFYATMDPEELLKKAQQGDAEAQYWYGRRLAEGRIGKERDFNRAIEWYRKSALQGNPQGQDALGRLLIDGRGAPQDYKEGYFWRALGARTDAEREDARSAVKEFLSARQLHLLNQSIYYWRPGKAYTLSEEGK